MEGCAYSKLNGTSFGRVHLELCEICRNIRQLSFIFLRIFDEYLTRNSPHILRLADHRSKLCTLHAPDISYYVHDCLEGEVEQEMVFVPHAYRWYSCMRCSTLRKKGCRNSSPRGAIWLSVCPSTEGCCFHTNKRLKTASLTDSDGCQNGTPICVGVSSNTSTLAETCAKIGWKRHPKTAPFSAKRGAVLQNSTPMHRVVVF